MVCKSKVTATNVPFRNNFFYQAQAIRHQEWIAIVIDILIGHISTLLKQTLILWASLLTFITFPVRCFDLVSKSHLGGFGQDNINSTVLGSPLFVLG